MATKNFKKRPSGPNEPKAVGVFLDEMLRSDSHLAAAYRKYREAIEAEAEGETGLLIPDSHLCVDVKVFSTKPGRMPENTFLEGYFARRGEDQFLIVEKMEKSAKTTRRNPLIYAGSCVNVHQLADGTKRLDFNHPRFFSNLSFRDFCLTAAQELSTIARHVLEDSLE